MIHWLIESAQDLTEKPEWFLSKPEQQKLKTFYMDKRREEWLLGRWTAKRLVQAVMLERDNHILALDAIEIANDAEGAPYAALQVERLTLNLSLSHSHEHALCALAPFAVGADLEWIEPRAENFIGDYFTANEIARVHASPPAQRAIVTNALWSAKEAALKALRKGLSVDTRAVEITLPAFELAPEHWTPFEINLRRSESLWSPNEAQPQDTAPALRGWWQILENFVLTIAAGGDDLPEMEPLFPESILVAHRAALAAEHGATHEQGHGILHRRIAKTTRHHPRYDQGH
jgi:4'-phosphopantetheinyl transferase